MMSNCGQEEHSTDCLCDVKLAEIAEITEESTKLWMKGMYVDLVLRACGDGMLEEPNGLLQLMESCAKARDIVDKKMNPARPPRRDVYNLKNAIKDWLRSGESIIDAPAEFGRPFGECVKALTSHRPSIVWTWDEERWAEVESYVLENRPVGDRRMAKDLELSRMSARSLCEYYGTMVASTP